MRSDNKNDYKPIINTQKMKKIALTLSLVIFVLVSCEKKGNNGKTVGETKEAHVEATSSTTWHYFSFENNGVTGTGEENETDNAAWFGRDDWDIAISRYSIRTNSGSATTINSRGGVYTYDEETTFSSITEVPADVEFSSDEPVTTSGHGGTTTTIKSAATVIVFQTNKDGSRVMPPVYLQAPVYIFRSADGEKYFKVLFTQYQNDESVSGHVKFDFAEIE